MTAPALPGAAPDPAPGRNDTARLPPEVERALMAFARTTTLTPESVEAVAALRAAIMDAMRAAHRAEVERAVREAVEQEREACALVCDRRSSDFSRLNVDGGMGKARSYHFAKEADACAAAIRARGEKS